MLRDEGSQVQAKTFLDFHFSEHVWCTMHLKLILVSKLFQNTLACLCFVVVDVTKSLEMNRSLIYYNTIA